jgi:hypothetical protein
MLAPHRASDSEPYRLDVFGSSTASDASAACAASTTGFRPARHVILHCFRAPSLSPPAQRSLRNMRKRLFPPLVGGHAGGVARNTEMTCPDACRTAKRPAQVQQCCQNSSQSPFCLLQPGFTTRVLNGRSHETDVAAQKSMTLLKVNSDGEESYRDLLPLGEACWTTPKALSIQCKVLAVLEPVGGLAQQQGFRGRRVQSAAGRRALPPGPRVPLGPWELSL